MALVVPNPPHDRKRVKVYELRNNDWFDRGTGFCVGQIVEDEPRIHVESEDTPERILLETKISKDDMYQKQQDTLIVWTEPNGVDMALSFQEADGCAMIWDFVGHVQQQLSSMAGQDDALSDDAIETFSNQPVALPAPELGNLADIEQAMRAASATQEGRDALSKLVFDTGYIPKLIPLVTMAEDLESLLDLHRLCNIMKTLILLNDTAIIEYVVTDDIILGVVGALEYDPDFPNHKANHRHYLSDESKYKEVVRIEDDDVRRKIHHTYRLQYLKDVVLARILDDPTFSVLNSLIFFNQVDIVQHLQGNSDFLQELFGVFGPHETDRQRKKNAVHFIQQCCAIAKNLQAPARAQLYTNFIQNGLFQVINFALRHQHASVRIAGTDVLVAMIDHDPAMMRAFILKQINDNSVPLTDTLIELLLVEVDLGVKAQIADAIKVLLDPQSSAPAPEGGSGGGSGGGGSGSNFYDESAKKLFRPLKQLQQRQTMKGFSIQEVSLFSHLVEILCFFIRQHLFRSKFFIVAEGLASRVAQLLACPEKHLKLIALKFFRTCIQLQDDFYNRQIMQNNLFEPILNIVYETMPRDNLLNSACLELFEYIKRETIKPLVYYIVDNHRDEIQNITYVDTFQDLLLRYEQLKDPAFEQQQQLQRQQQQLQQQQQQQRAAAGREGEMVHNRAHINGGQRWQGVKEMDAAEEAYFNSSDDEDELSSSNTTTNATGTTNNNASITSPNFRGKPKTNGVPTTLKPLVDYPDDDDSDDSEDDDDEDDEEKDVSMTESSRAAADDDDGRPTPSHQPSRKSRHAAQQTSTRNSTTAAATAAAAAAAAAASPPERLSEKRRRVEDEEDDELVKLSSQIKRRSSSASLSSVASSATPTIPTTTTTTTTTTTHSAAPTTTSATSTTSGNSGSGGDWGGPGPANVLRRKRSFTAAARGDSGVNLILQSNNNNNNNSKYASDVTGNNVAAALRSKDNTTTAVPPPGKIAISLSVKKKNNNPLGEMSLGRRRSSSGSNSSSNDKVDRGGGSSSSSSSSGDGGQGGGGSDDTSA
ncbi:MAG: hypothetical protein M1825_001346 [Sarcosagium campestre]|nr:MAG: hypothetical protein M1825_001346 [Sarcosagium campestre]